MSDATRITDEAVEALSESLIGAAWATFDEGLLSTLRAIHRAALEAALPHLEGATPPPLEQVIEYLHEYQHGDRKCVQGNCRKRDTAANLAPAARALFHEGAAPAIDRDGLATAAHQYYCVTPDEPTHYPDETDYDKADEILEILALLGGSTS